MGARPRRPRLIAARPARVNRDEVMPMDEDLVEGPHGAALEALDLDVVEVQLFMIVEQVRQSVCGQPDPAEDPVVRAVRREADERRIGETNPARRPPRRCAGGRDAIGPEATEAASLREAALRRDKREWLERTSRRRHGRGPLCHHAWMTTIRWGILGPGRISTRLVRGIRASAHGDLVAVGSRDAGRAAAYAATHGIPQRFGSYEALLAAPDVDVVYIAVPNHLHAEWAVKALQAGKHVLCEKPLALTLEEVDAIAAAAERSGRIAVEAFMYLHHPQILKAIELARSGALGTLELVQGTFSFFLDDDDDPRADPAMGGGSLWDVGCYPVSFARRLAGEEPDRVAAFARFDERGVDRTFIGQLHFPGGLLAQFDCGFAAPHRERMEIVGSDATLVLHSPFLPEPDGLPPSLAMVRDRVSTPIEVGSLDQYTAEVDDLTAAILDGRPPTVTREYSRGTIATIVDLYDAARASRREEVGSGWTTPDGPRRQCIPATRAREEEEDTWQRSARSAASLSVRSGSHRARGRGTRGRRAAVGRDRSARSRRTTPSGRSPAAGTRRSSTRSGARSRTRPSTPGTCSTPRSRCGTPGPPTTRRRRATSSTRRTAHRT